MRLAITYVRLHLDLELLDGGDEIVHRLDEGSICSFHGKVFSFLRDARVSRTIREISVFKRTIPKTR